MFRIPTVTFDSRELLAYTVLGVFGGIAALIFSKALGFLRPRLRKQPAWAQMLQPGLAGLLVGGIGYFGLPQVMGAGYEVIDQAMHAQFAWKMLLLLALFKIIATTLSFSSGTPGGMFAPTLFIGAMLGAAIGAFEKLYFPHLHLTGSLASYALVGMGVLFAAFLRAPLTSVFMVLEVSGNYSIIVPVILANTIAYVISRSFQPIPVFEMLTHQDGLYLPSMEEQREESELHIEDALQPVVAPILQGSETIADAIKSVAQYSTLEDSSVILVHCGDGLWYAATCRELKDIFENPDQPDAALSLEKRLGEERTPVLFPDLPLASTLPHFKRWPLLPITNRAMRGALEGTISMADVLKRYQGR
jgi:CIC family chloride channel protein